MNAIEELCEYLALEEVVPITGNITTEWERKQVRYLKRFAEKVISHYKNAEEFGYLEEDEEENLL